MSADFIPFAVGGEESAIARKRIRSRAAAHSHRSGTRKPKSKSGVLDGSDSQSGRYSSASVSASTSRASSRRSSLAPEHNCSHTSIDTRRPGANNGQFGLHLQFKLVPQRGGFNTLSAPLRQRWEQHWTDATTNSQLESFDLRESARIGRSQVYPVPEQQFFAKFLDFAWPWMLRSWAHMPDTTPEERDAALQWVQRLTLTDPAYFYMNMLSVAGALSIKNLCERSFIPYLTAQVVRAINVSLSQGGAHPSMGCILAVGRIALREIVLGDYEAGTKVHRPAQARMLAMAGGVENLGLPSLVLKHILWSDRVMTERTGLEIDRLEPSAIRSSLLRPGEQEDQAMLASYRPDRPRPHDFSKEQGAKLEYPAVKAGAPGQNGHQYQVSIEANRGLQVPGYHTGAELDFPSGLPKC